jgi:hypothetical protein
MFCRLVLIMVREHWLWGSFRYRVAAPALVFICLGMLALPIEASNHYTAKQIEVLAERVGRTYWVDSANNRPVLFLSAPKAGAPTFASNPYESFEIEDLVGANARNPFYKVKLESGREGYIQPDDFLEQLNVGIVSVDPKADEKRRATAAAEEENKRLVWIEAQPWSRAVKDAAVKKRPVLGMTAGEISKVLGTPRRSVKVHGAQRFNEEHWFYPDGEVLVFRNGLLREVKKQEKAEQ